ncbi:MAG: class A beta-lactamase [Rhodobiaceae bacterium]|nr:class A beta-lactamase [Rhodobiaceae bacterium]
MRLHQVSKFFGALLIAVTGATAPLYAGDNVILETVRDIESRLGGRIGISIHDTGSGQRWEHRADERFPLSSTFKPFACAAVLTRIESGAERLHRVIEIEDDDLVSYSPLTETRVNTVGMTIAELCEATITLSDNTAGNLILESIGGPKAFTDYMRTIGDDTSRLDRWETDLNEGTPGDKRDTTTPRAAAASLNRLLLGQILSVSSREQLTTWMENDKVADALLRSALPEDWRIADKTGAGGHGARSIIAVIWPPAREPLVISIYVTENDASFAERNQAIAEIGAAIVETVGN